MNNDNTSASEIFYNMCSSCEYNGYAMILNGMVALLEEHEDDYSIRLPEAGERFMASEVLSVREVEDSSVFAKIKVKHYPEFEVSIMQPLRVKVETFRD